MGLTTADNYYLKAKALVQGYSNDWEEVCESLNYALSYDENHCASLCLLGEVYAEHLMNYQEAFKCFDRVIAFNMDYLKVYPLYARYLIWVEEFSRAQKLIAFAFNLKGIDKAELYCLTAYTLETQGKFKLSLKMLKKSRLENYNESYQHYLSDEVKRVKNKIKITNNVK